RPTPVLVRGVWDCVGLLFAASGLLLVVLPALLRMLYRRSIGDILVDQPGFTDLITGIFVEYWLITLLYYLFVVSGVALLIWARWNKTIIYNVDGERLIDVLQRSLAQLNLEATRAGNELIIARAPEPNVVAEPSVTDLEVAPTPRLTRSVHPEAILIIEPF